jgi:hypothetical protein
MAVRRGSRAIHDEPESKARARKAAGAPGSGAPEIADKQRPLHQNTPLDITALPADTVTITDPTHPLYGRTFPLISMTNKQRLGRVCVVWLSPGIERVIPVASTTQDARLLTHARCRLSVEGLHTLLAVVRSWQNPGQETPYGDVAYPHQGSRSTPCPPTPRAGICPPGATARSTTDCPPASVEESDAYTASAGPTDAPAHPPGGAL